MKVSLWAEIKRLADVEKFSRRIISRRLHCSRKTVDKALQMDVPPTKVIRAKRSILDPHKSKIDALIKKYPGLSAVRVLEEIRKGEDPYGGEITLVRDYLRATRPVGGRIYQEVDYLAGDAMQVDWGSCGYIRVGKDRRRISVFVGVLCYSRLIYIEFSLSEKKEDFYRCTANALGFFGGATARIIHDNLKAAVLKGSGRNAVHHCEFLALCGYFRLEPVACERRDPETKGVVEGSVRYVKRNALQGRDEELISFEDYQRLAVYWRDQVANVRNHRTTRERPIDRFEKERSLLRRVPEMPYDTDRIIEAVVTPHARIRFETNRYSVPPEVVRKHVMLRVDEKSIRVIQAGKEVAHHRRIYDKHQLIIDPDHQKAAFLLRRRSQARIVEAEFDRLCAEAKAFRLGLLRGPLRPAVHIRRILELSRIYGKTEACEAVARAVQLQTFDSAYVTNLINQQRRRRRLPSPVPLTPQRRDLVEELQLDEPDPSVYDDLFGLDSNE